MSHSIQNPFLKQSLQLLLIYFDQHHIFFITIDFENFKLKIYLKNPT